MRWAHIIELQIFWIQILFFPYIFLSQLYFIMLMEVYNYKSLSISFEILQTSQSTRSNYKPLLQYFKLQIWKEERLLNFQRLNLTVSHRTFPIISNFKLEYFCIYLSILCSMQQPCSITSLYAWVDVGKHAFSPLSSFSQDHRLAYALQQGCCRCI